MGARIRRGTLSVNGSGRSLVSKFSWKDAVGVDRSKADNTSWGKPVVVSKGGSGSFEALATWTPGSGYGTASMVFTWKEIAVSNGSETPTSRTATFTKVTFNVGGRVPIEGTGRVLHKFDYAVCTLA